MAESITGAPPISTLTFPHSDIGLDGAHLKSPKSEPESRHQGGCGSRPGSTRGAQLACPARVLPAQEARGLGTVSSRSSVVRGSTSDFCFPNFFFSACPLPLPAFRLWTLDFPTLARFSFLLSQFLLSLRPLSAFQFSAFQHFPQSSTTRTVPVPIFGLTRFRQNCWLTSYPSPANIAACLVSSKGNSPLPRAALIAYQSRPKRL
jgi:hypothetical protein